ncbi:phospholipid phosphatase-related protein type 5-like [Tubulanus polymorphus]|uniref:phospholipid phosphatase-related protein type 5-like n=1 Tax=Tubulanus polymorphus TaxID=672921 RepID=UPI003DA4AA51
MFKKKGTDSLLDSMATYSAYGSRRDSFDRIELTERVKDDHWITSETSEKSDKGTHVHVRRTPRCLAVLSVFTDLLLLGGLIVLEYFLRWGQIFPVRNTRFECVPATLNPFATTVTGYENFFLNGNLNLELLLVLTFCIPPFIMLICEVVVWALNRQKPKEFQVDICCNMSVPHLWRRCIRIVGMFAFGAFLTMIVCDSIKLLLGGLRPNFLDICKLNAPCQAGKLYTVDNCGETDKTILRDARMSFPSLQTAITAFASIYLSVYLHGVTRSHGKTITIPFFCVTFVMCSVVRGLTLIGTNRNDWKDVLAGFLLGCIMALYLGVYVMNRFEYRDNISNRKVYKKLHMLITMEKARADAKEKVWSKSEKCLYNFDETGSNPQLAGGLPSFHNGIPRPTVSHPNNRDQAMVDDPDNMDRYRQNTFQRDLQRTIDQYRRTSPTDWSQHM